MTDITNNMKTTISYDIPETQLDSILDMLGYTEGDKATFLNEAIRSVVIPAITDKFIVIKQLRAQETISHIPSETRQNVESMISITTE